MTTLDFKLALFGQIYDNEGLLYSYPEKVLQLRASGQYPVWVNALPLDSRFLRELVASGGECFSIRYGKEGLFYLYTRYNPHDSRNGAVSVVLYTQNYAASDAQQLIITLRNLMDYFLEKQSPIGISDADIAEITKNLSSPYSIKLPTQQPETLGNDVYRIYQNEEELQCYLKWAIQKEYIEYKWVHFISSEYKKAAINPSLYTEITSRVMDCYAIKRSETSYELALSGTNYNLNYTKEGFLPQTVTAVIGQPSIYIEENNHIIRFKTLNEIDLKFKKKITILLYDSATGAPIVENGKTITFPVEVEEGKTRNVSVYASGYVSQAVLVDPSKFNNAEGEIRKSLKREVTTSQVQQNNNYDYENEAGTEDSLCNLKKHRITTIALAVIALIIGCAGGFYAGKYVQQSKDTFIIDSLMEKNNVLFEENANLKEKIHTMNIQTPSNNSTPNQTTSTTTTSTTSSTMQNAEDLKKQAKQKAIEFLKTKNEWSLVGMRRSVSDQSVKSKIPNTDEYKWLKYITEGDQLDDDKLDKIISNEDALLNNDWAEIVNLIKVKRNQGKSISQFKKAFKDANFNWDSKKECPKKDSNNNNLSLIDGTVNLALLKRNIKAI